ncbi:hypothetical protein HanIR_Chr06g0285381 [Helianthus annuus]|nr:hypothetical protein HanIR_Chr06g0285381 [Helianthus annuus]
MNEHEQRMRSFVYVRERSIMFSFMFAHLCSFVFVHLKVFMCYIFIFIGFILKIFDSLVILYASSNIPYLTISISIVLTLEKLLNFCVCYVCYNCVKYVRIIMLSIYLFFCGFFVTFLIRNAFFILK